MDELIGPLIFVVIMVASAIGNAAERRRRRRMQEGEAPAPAVSEKPAQDTPRREWHAAPREVRNFLESLEKRLAGQEPAGKEAPAPREPGAGGPPILSPAVTTHHEQVPPLLSASN